MENEFCPHCNAVEWDGYECVTCGYSEIGTVDGEYETRSGVIIECTEEEAFDNGLIHICPQCTYNVITWWQLDDHGKCVECWHKERQKSLTK